MRLLGKDCGCEARQDIIFDAGKIGAPEAAILVGAVLAIIVALKLRGRIGNANVG